MVHGPLIYSGIFLAMKTDLNDSLISVLDL